VREHALSKLLVSGTLPLAIRSVAPQPDAACALRLLVVHQCAQRTWTRSLAVVSELMLRSSPKSMDGDISVVLWGVLQRSFGHVAERLPSAELLISAAERYPCLIERRAALAPFLSLVAQSAKHANVLPSTGLWQRVLSLVGDVTKSSRTCGKGSSLASIPSIAAGELLQAVFHAGASLDVVQKTLDSLTDPSLGAAADKNMRCHHLYAGYIRVAGWTHALEIYEHHAPHYGVRRTARVAAAMMSSLSEAHRYGESINLFDRFVAEAMGSDMYTHTAETVAELLTALQGRLLTAHDPGPETLDTLLMQAVDAINKLCASYGLHEGSLLDDGVVASNANERLETLRAWLRCVRQQGVAPQVVNAMFGLCRVLGDSYDHAAQSSCASGTAEETVDEFGDDPLSLMSRTPKEAEDEVVAMSAQQLSEFMEC
jgi:hypothetical protein